RRLVALGRTSYSGSDGLCRTIGHAPHELRRHVRLLLAAPAPAWVLLSRDGAGGCECDLFPSGVGCVEGRLADSLRRVQELERAELVSEIRLRRRQSGGAVHVSPGVEVWSLAAVPTDLRRGLAPRRGRCRGADLPPLESSQRSTTVTGCDRNNEGSESHVA